MIVYQRKLFASEALVQAGNIRFVHWSQMLVLSTTISSFTYFTALYQSKCFMQRVVLVLDDSVLKTELSLVVEHECFSRCFEVIA